MLQPMKLRGLPRIPEVTLACAEQYAMNTNTEVVIYLDRFGYFCYAAAWRMKYDHPGIQFIERTINPTDARVAVLSRETVLN